VLRPCTLCSVQALGAVFLFVRIGPIRFLAGCRKRWLNDEKDVFCAFYFVL